MKTPITKVPVSERALLQRINRWLENDTSFVVKKARKRAAATVGEYFILNILGNVVVDQDVDLETLGKELGVLQDWESVLSSD